MLALRMNKPGYDTAGETLSVPQWFDWLRTWRTLCDLSQEETKGLFLKGENVLFKPTNAAFGLSRPDVFDSFNINGGK